MTVAKKPSKTRPERRTVSVISVPEARPDDGLFNPFKEAKAAESAQEVPTQPSPTQPNPAQPSPTYPNPAQPDSIAATRDFNRRPNSIDRDGLPAGLFPGTSQKLYNALFLKTRGAIVPARTIQATKRELMEWSNIRSKNTIAVNLKLLCTLGWIKAHHEVGNHEGSIYEVLTFEELDPQSNPPQPIPAQVDPTQPNPTQKLGGDPTQFLGWVGLGKVDENKDTYAFPNTSFNTKEEKFDDEAFAELVGAFRQITTELTGKTPTAAESVRWKELAELLITELKIAAGRTTVSNVPAFLTEHLRRRLWKVDKRRATEIAVEPEQGSAPALTEEQRKTCPDCAGTNFWYPDGPDKGVARCTHQKLRPQNDATSP
jgi:hypothetical protein